MMAPAMAPAAMAGPMAAPMMAPMMAPMAAAGPVSSLSVPAVTTLAPGVRPYPSMAIMLSNPLSQSFSPLHCMTSSSTCPSSVVGAEDRASGALLKLCLESTGRGEYAHSSCYAL